jgi:thiamine-phosphate pyrophosphorylase
MIPGEWTESASRALAAIKHDSRPGQPRELFWALVDQESRASEILAAGGLDPQTLEQRLPRPAPSDDPTPNGLDVVLREAAGLAGLAGRVGEVGTEHLLFGLAQVDETIAEVLAEYDLRPESLAPVVEAAAGLETSPLETDETLEPLPTPGSATDTLRMMDASANRAREGLRVVEDIARFVLDDAHLTSLLKQLRHNLAAALKPLDDGRFLAARDTTTDVGTTLTTEREHQRGSMRDVLDANLSRVQESLRTLEELAKLQADPLPGRAPSAAALFEQTRYDLYTLHKALAGTLEARRRLDGRILYLLAGESGCQRGIGPAIRAAAAGGVGVVQLREKSLEDAALLELARRVRRWTRDAGVLFVMNDRPDLALLADADGVHVGQDELDVRSVRRIVGPGRLVGVSTHSIQQARQAVLDGADYLGVGPVFDSQTKSFDSLAGLEFVTAVAAEITLPWYAIGGISGENLEQVTAAGATRVAVGAAVCGAEDPETAARTLHRALAATE